MTLRQALADNRDKPLLLGGYWPAVDTLAHKYGPDDETIVFSSLPITPYTFVVSGKIKEYENIFIMDNRKKVLKKIFK